MRRKRRSRLIGGGRGRRPRLPGDVSYRFVASSSDPIIRSDLIRGEDCPPWAGVEASRREAKKAGSGVAARSCICGAAFSLQLTGRPLRNPTEKARLDRTYEAERTPNLPLGLWRRQTSKQSLRGKSRSQGCLFRASSASSALHRLGRSPPGTREPRPWEPGWAPAATARALSQGRHPSATATGPHPPYPKLGQPNLKSPRRGP